MKITDALQIESNEAVAIVGAGGKTSLMFALAKALHKPVCLTTTTRLAYAETADTFNHLMFSDFVAQGCHFNAALPTLVTNPLENNQRKWLGLSLNEAEQLIAFCGKNNVPCLIEADGARHLSLKAPAEWEPVIPPQVSKVIVMVGLSVIGKPLTEEYVFRSELFSKLTGLPLNDTIQLEHVLRMLKHPEGSLKGIPPGSKAVAVFNQGDAYSLKPQELDLVRRSLYDDYVTVILTSLQTDPVHCGVIFERD